MARPAQSSPRSIARVAGFFYLFVFLTGIPLALAAKLVVRGDAAATTANILAHQGTWWLGFSAELLQVASYIVVTALFYALFKPVNRPLALIATLLSIVGCAIQALAFVFYTVPLELSSGTQPLGVFKVEQIQALALTSLKVETLGYDIGLVFFGFYDFLIGYLIFASTFLPRPVGILMSLAGLGFLTFLWPPLANAISPFILLGGLIGEGALTVWLLTFGVDDQRWKEQADASATFV